MTNKHVLLFIAYLGWLAFIIIPDDEYKTLLSIICWVGGGIFYGFYSVLTYLEEFEKKK